jgi:hypothetical protein
LSAGKGGCRDSERNSKVVEDVVEVGEVDGGGVVEVAGGPGEGGGAEVAEDGVEVVEVDGAVEVGVAGEGGGDEDGVGVDGLAARLEAWLKKHDDMPGPPFLQAIIPWAVKRFGFDADKFVHELIDSIIGDHYPVPDLMLVHDEQIVHEYLQWAMCGAPRPKGKFRIYAVEDGTATMCYIFKSLKNNRIVNPGDTIALGVPLFTPYLEMAHLEDYDLRFVEVKASQENKFQYTDEELEKLLDRLCRKPIIPPEFPA